MNVNGQLLKVTPAPLTVGVSLKMYFSYARTIQWCTRIAELAEHHEAVQSGLVDLFVLPTFPAIEEVLRLFSGTRVSVGAQDLAVEDSGAFTGEVSGALLAELGCRYAEVGHAERRRLFQEDDATVVAKTNAALRNGLIPVLCVGEDQPTQPEIAAGYCGTQISSALGSSTSSAIVAYEPQWAIGAKEPAEPQYVAEVCDALRAHAADGVRLIYGGSAGPGLLTDIAGSVDGLFLGRFAHDPRAVKAILDEALALRGGTPPFLVKR